MQRLRDVADERRNVDADESYDRHHRQERDLQHVHPPTVRGRYAQPWNGSKRTISKFVNVLRKGSLRPAL